MQIRVCYLWFGRHLGKFVNNKPNKYWFIIIINAIPISPLIHYLLLFCFSASFSFLASIYCSHMVQLHSSNMAPVRLPFQFTHPPSPHNLNAPFYSFTTISLNSFYLFLPVMAICSFVLGPLCYLPIDMSLYFCSL